MSGTQKQHQKQEGKASVKAKKTEQKASQHLNAMQMMEAPETLRSEDVLTAQQQVGNQVVQRTLGKGKRNAAATDEQGNLRPELASTIQQKRGGGEALPEGVRREAHKVLGKEFKNVRIHTDSTSDKLSRSVSARAFTIGSDIFFKSGVFAPGTSKGRETLMHELTHVVQQAGSSKSSGGKLKLGAPGTAMEKEADHIGKKHAQAKVGATASAIGTVQKAPLDDEELLQGQPEEEELQMQPDAGNVVQRVEDEELIQGAPDEEELQMQPDVGNVVQRDWEDGVFDKGKLNYKKYSKSVLGGQRIAPGISKQVAMFGGGIGQTKKTDEESSPKSPTVKKKVLSRPKPQVSVKKPPINKVSGSDPKTQEDQDARPMLKRTKRSMNLRKTDKDSGTDPKDKAKTTTWAKGQIPVKEPDKDLQIGKKDTGTDPKTIEDQEKKPRSKWQKFKGFAKKAGSKAWGGAKLAGMAAIGLVGSKVKKNLTEAKEQFFGKKKEEKKEETPKASPVTINNYAGGGSGGGGVGGGGGGGMAETISDLFQENKRLKTQIAELEKEKA